MKNQKGKTRSPADAAPERALDAKSVEACYGRIRDILSSARATAARSVNTAQVVSYWLIGRESV